MTTARRMPVTGSVCGSPSRPIWRRETGRIADRRLPLPHIGQTTLSAGTPRLTSQLACSFGSKSTLEILSQRSDGRPPRCSRARMGFRAAFRSHALRLARSWPFAAGRRPCTAGSGPHQLAVRIAAQLQKGFPKLRVAGSNPVVRSRKGREPTAGGRNPALVTEGETQRRKTPLATWALAVRVPATEEFPNLGASARSAGGAAIGSAGSDARR